MRHLTPDQMIDWSTGSDRSPVVLRHLSRCARCRQELEDHQVLDALAAPPQAPAAPVLHPSSALLTAYAYGQLSNEKRRQVRDHLRTCDGCAASLLDLHRYRRSALGRAPEASMLAAVKARMAAVVGRQADSDPQLHRTEQATRRPLGRMIVEIIGASDVGLIFRPAPGVATFSAARPAAMAAAESLPFYRARRAATQAGPQRTMPGVEPGEGPARSQPVELLAGAVRLVFSLTRSEQINRLEITATDAANPRPVAGLDILLQPGTGSPRKTRTDVSGRAFIDLPAGETRLLIGAEPAWEVMVRAVVREED